jgi:hypothetical protein
VPTVDVAVEVDAKRFTTAFMDAMVWWAKEA